MIQTHFILQNIHFTLNIITAFIFFAVFWLYLDAWISRKYIPDAWKILGFLVVGLSFGLSAVYIEQTILAQSLFGSQNLLLASSSTRIAGYILIIIGLVTDPLQKRPVYSKENVAAVAMVPNGVWLTSPLFLLPVLSVTVGLLYLRRATVGLENHLKPVSLAFFTLSLAELAGIAPAFRSTANVTVSSLVSPFGFAWIVAHVFLFISVIIFGMWVFQYLLTRIRTQLYILFTTGIMVVCLLITMTFTTLLLNSMQQEALNHLTTDVNVLQYAIDSKKSELLADTNAVAKDPAIASAVIEKNRQKLQELTKSRFLTKKQSSFTVLTADGMVLYRAEDPEKYGESFSSNQLFSRALSTGPVSSVITRPGVVAPEIFIESAAPLESEGKIVGAVLISTQIDNAFLDGIKETTGLDVALYGDRVRSATTFKAADGKSKWIGITEQNPDVLETVLQKGKTFRGQADLLNVSYLTVYAPLRNIDTNPVGMLLVAKEQTSVLQTAAASIQITFIVAALLLALSFIPAYFIARYIAYQVR